MGTRTHNLRDWSLSFMRTIVVGYGTNGAIRFEPDGPAWEAQTGTSGEEQRSAQNNDGFTLVLQLQQTSPYNDVLSAFLTADKQTGSAKGPFSATHTRGTSFVRCGEAYVMGPPTYNVGRNAEDVEWRIRLTAPVSYHFGGSL